MRYQHGPYSVDLGSDGAIKVKHRDWLSKYSAAMFNTYWRVHEFGRMGRSGLAPIAKPNLIYVGETVYHIPTYNKFQSSQSPAAYAAKPIDWVTLVNRTAAMVPARVGPAPTETAKRELTRAALAHDFELHGDVHEAVHTALDITHYASGVAEILEVVHLLGHWAGTAAGAANMIVLPTIAFLEILSALEVGETLAKMGAVAYTTTAWAFDDPIPGYPQRIKDNLRMNGMADKIGSRERAWQTASRETVHHLADLAKKERVSTKSLKIALRAVAGDDRQALCRLVLKGFEGKVRTDAERARLREFGTEYPN